MEKPRMGAGRTIYRTGLLMKILTIFLLNMILIFPAAVYPQDSGPGVSLELSSTVPAVGVPWRLTFLVDHAVPDEVTITVPPFAGFLHLDRYAKYPRTIDAHVHTVIEYVFIPNRSGRLLIAPFRITTPAGTTETNFMAFDIEAPEIRQLTHQFIWEGAPRQMAAGERAVFSLRFSGMGSLPPHLPLQEFMPEVPPGAILASLPLTEAEREIGFVLRLNLIPLEGDFLLPARVIRQENVVYEIPSLSIRVSGLAAEISENALHGNTAEIREERTEEVPLYPQFPGFHFEVFEKTIMGKVWGSQFKDIYNTAKELWDNGLYAQALTELRRNERNHPAGLFLRQIRREAEESLGVFDTENENRWRKRFLFAMALFLFLIVTILPFVYFALIRRPLWKKTVLLLFTIVFALFGFLCIYLFMNTRNVFHGKNSRFGITTETPVRRLADNEGQELFSFKEGQPVEVMLNSGDWIFVRAKDKQNKAGWIPVTAIIFY